MASTATEHPSLNQFSIEGLRGVGHVELDFHSGQRVYTLFGANGIGKTKCLEAIYQILLLTNSTFSADDLNREIEPSALLFDELTVRSTSIGLSRKTLGLYLKKGIGLHGSPAVLVAAHGRSNISNDFSRSSFLGDFSTRRHKYFEGQSQLIYSNELRRSGMRSDILEWFVTRAQSVNPFQKNSDNRRVEIDTVLQMLHQLDERIAANVLQIDGGGRVFIQVEGQMCGLTELSSGFTSLVKLVQAIVSGYAAFTNEVQLRHVRGVVLIDEIESHLHAQWQAQIIPKLKELLPNTTFFIATHSPLVLAQLQEGEAYLLKRDAEGVVRSEMIEAPNRRAFADVLESAFGVDLNALKRQALLADDQSAAKLALLAMLQQPHSFGEGA